jgi:hypothetical protein
MSMRKKMLTAKMYGTEIQVFPETDSEDSSGWGYGWMWCPYYRNPESRTVDLECHLVFADPMDLMSHVQSTHKVDLAPESE